MTRWWVDCQSRLFCQDDGGDRRVPVSRDVVYQVLREHGMDVAVSAWVPDGIAREILDRAGARARADSARASAHAA